MKPAPNRLPADARHGFGGAALDRGKPVSFRLDGRRYGAFEGDTVLSALLAAGVDTAGTYNGEPIGLDERFAPPVIPKSEQRDLARSLPMDRVPVMSELNLVTVGPRQSRLTPGRFAPRLLGDGRTLGLRLDDPRALEGAWSSRRPDRTIDTDTIVVGGGIAGMSAALAAAGNGRVVLIERRPALGGDTRFFGAVGDQESPEAAIARLSGRIAATPAITVLTAADAFWLAGPRVRAHQIAARDGRLVAEVIAVNAARVVLATGAAERLPVFPGNRAPAVVGAVAAFHRAERYGVWLGRRAIFATPHNFAYRLGLLAADAGIEVQRVVDSRVGPNSRFVDFAKASGITLASGLAIRSAEPQPGRTGRLKVGFAVAIEEAHGNTEPLTTDLLVAAGGWQPRLALWLMAGGASAYDGANRWLAARGTLDAVALAGSAAGLRSSPACLESGERAVAALLGKDGPPAADTEVDATYETREAATTIAPWRIGRGVAFLDGGLSFSARTPPRRESVRLPAAQLHSLSVGDVAAAVETGTVPLADAGIVAQERCMGSGDLDGSSWRLPSPPARYGGVTVPAWLVGRFGRSAKLVTLAALDGRSFEPGCLIYGNTDDAHPDRAIGVIVADERGAAMIAYAGAAALEPGATLFVRDISGPVAARLAQQVQPVDAV